MLVQGARQEQQMTRQGHKTDKTKTQDRQDKDTRPTRQGHKTNQTGRQKHILSHIHRQWQRQWQKGWEWQRTGKDNRAWSPINKEESTRGTGESNYTNKGWQVGVAKIKWGDREAHCRQSHVLTQDNINKNKHKTNSVSGQNPDSYHRLHWMIWSWIGLIRLQLFKSTTIIQ